MFAVRIFILVIFYLNLDAYANGMEEEKEESFLVKWWDELKPNTLIYTPINKSELYNRKENINFLNSKEIQNFPSYITTWTLVRTTVPKSNEFDYNFRFGLDFNSSYFKRTAEVYNYEKKYKYTYEIESLNLYSGLGVSLVLDTPLGQVIPKVSLGPSYHFIKDSFIKEGNIITSVLSYSLNYYYYFKKDNIVSVSMGSYGIYGETIENDALELGGWSYLRIGFGWIL